jgi:peroxiredoxin Q/BCP
MARGDERSQTTRAIHVGDRAPDFTLPDRDGQPVTLRNFRGQTVVLYFYPRDHTTVCTAQACRFRDRHEMFRLANAVVIGVSSDTTMVHERFAQQHGLPFRLLADERGRVRALYRVPRLLGLFPGRVTYVIDRDGIVRHVIKAHFSPGRHIREALQAASLLSVGARGSPPRG